MKIALMCDMHMPAREDTVQYEYFLEAVNDIKKSNAEMTIVAGDIAGIGEKNAFEFFDRHMKDIPHITVLGNSDVRSGDIDTSAYGGSLDCGRKILCINTPYARISEADRKSISELCDGDIIIMHHSIPGLDEDSREFIKNTALSKKLIIIHAHSHNFQDYCIGDTRVICIRALDPDKSIGKPPCITYFDITDKEFSFYEKCFVTNYEDISDFRDYLGMSCFDVEHDFDFAMKYSVKNLELRKYSEETHDYVIAKIKEWRNHGGRVLSVHMPNVWFRDGKIDDSGWDYAKKLVIEAGADSITIHPPRVSVGQMEAMKIGFAKYYADVIRELPKTVSVGFENLHMKNGEKTDKSRGFGYIPDEVISLTDSVNAELREERAGVVLDVGHARNNPPYNSEYILGMWYAIVGNRTIAYHIHQVARKDGVLKNHTAIDNWFGPMISYSSFFRAWKNGQINKRPAFLEIRDISEIEKSILSFDAMAEQGQF